jgi:N-acetylglucosaminyl-diphospho-decaprenol L-rhamnosyltransferase
VSSPILSVVIPHYGDPGPVQSLVAKLVPQARRLGAEIIVVDDGSPEPLEPLPGSTLITRDGNGGFGAAVNAGVAGARGSLVAILNSDLVVSDDFLECYLEAAQAHLPAVVAPQVITYDHIGSSTFRFPEWTNVLAQRINVIGNRRHRRRVSDLIGEDKPSHPEDTHVVDWVSGAAMLLPTAEFREAGGFDERFHMYLEEVDLQKRLALRGVPAVYVGSVVVEHLGFASSPSSLRELWQLQSWLVYAEKWGWRRRLRLAVEVAALVNLVTDTMRRALGRETTPLRTWSERRHLVRTVWSAHDRRQT